MSILKFARKCDCCGVGMNAGHYDSGSYYCTDECLLKANRLNNPKYTIETWNSDCEEYEDECYWTEWTELDDEYYYTERGKLVKT